MNDDSLLQEFLQESREHLATIETDLLAMEEAGANADDKLVNKVFRAAHSIKGGAGFFTLDTIMHLAHHIENALQMVRSRDMVSTPEVVNILLIAFDRLRELIQDPRGTEGRDIEDMVLALTGLVTSNLPEAEKQSLSTPAVLAVAPGKQHLIQISQFDLKHASKGGRFIYLLHYDLIHDVHRHGKVPWTVFKELTSVCTVMDCCTDLEAVGTLDDDAASVIPFQVLVSTVLEDELVATLTGLSADKIERIQVAGGPLAQLPATPGARPAAPPPTPAPVKIPAAGPVLAAPAQEPLAASETTLRVALPVLERLMDLAGEMVLGRNQLMEAISRQDSRAILAGAHRIDLVTSELQESIMLTRMQPVGNVLGRFPRVVRDLSRELGKDINLVMVGKEVELDRSILEGLSDPLTHMVRNAVDHGIELPDERIQKGKNPAGTLHIRVFHEAGQVVVEIKDDGKGLDTERIAAKAKEKGLITAEQMKSMSAKEKMALIFLPGLSTSEKVSNLSGRGVGMDVVRTNLEKLGGTTDIQSQLGKGTTFTIKLPLTLAIVPSLLISIGPERFAIPQVNVAELLRIAPDQVQQRIETVGDTEVLVLRGELIPLLRLSEVLDVSPTYKDLVSGESRPEQRKRLADRRGRHLKVDEPSGEPIPGRGADRRTRDGYLNIVVVNAGVLQYGIVVEALHDTVEIVVKPLGRHLKGLREYAGATILGDGGVALIVDVVSLAGRVGMTSQGGSTRATELADERALELGRDRHAFLLFANGHGEACAVPLEQVARVERLEPGQIETHGGRRTMQYRGGSLPLVALSDATKLAPLSEEQKWVVIVFSQGGREVGLLGAQPVDSIEADVVIDQQIHRQTGIAGSTILRNRTTLIVDMHELASGLITDQAEPAPSIGQADMTLLLAEDSDFFRQQVQKYLQGDGYKVIAAEDGEAAWQKLLAHAGEIRAVVSDIEMPRLTGFELVQRIRSDPRFAELPVIALTSLAGDDDIVRGKAAGFSEYQIKLDRDRLLESLRKYLSASPITH
jgi:two-component system chemotaxis sensor kinase CheA